MNDDVFSSPLNANFYKEEKYAIKKEAGVSEEWLSKLEHIETNLKYKREMLHILLDLFQGMLGNKKK